jgi:hypothetical protein
MLQKSGLEVERNKNAAMSVVFKADSGRYLDWQIGVEVSKEP